MTHLEVRELRSKTGLTQSEFASKMFKTRDCIAKWESGKFAIPKYADILLTAVFK
jgi:DNA-binding transcriptional regulator YiaG